MRKEIGFRTMPTDAGIAAAGCQYNRSPPHAARQVINAAAGYHAVSVLFISTVAASLPNETQIGDGRKPAANPTDFPGKVRAFVAILILPGQKFLCSVSKIAFVKSGDGVPLVWKYGGFRR